MSQPSIGCHFETNSTDLPNANTRVQLSAGNEAISRITFRGAANSDGAFEHLDMFRRDGEGFVRVISPGLGFTWLTTDALAPGGWMLRLEAKGYRRWEQSVVVQAGETTPVRVSLERE